MDTRIFKAKNNESGTITALLSAAEVSSAHVSPVPAQAPGVIVLRPGEATEEHIYYKTRDAGAGIVSGLTRDYSNLNGGTGREHANGSSWETMQAAEYINNMVDALIEGYLQEQATIAYVGASSFTVLGDVTAIYTAGRILRYNQDNTKVGIVASSSYSGGSGLTTITTNYGTVPASLTHVEIAIMPKAGTTLLALTSSIQSGSYVYAADAGSNDAYAITLSPAPTAYVAGMKIGFKANTINTGAATLNVNALGAKNIKKYVNGQLVDLKDGDISATEIVTVMYDGTQFLLQTPTFDENTTSSSMARQALMNANFDVWQRGTSLSLVDITVKHLADRWGEYVDKNGGTLPTLTRSRQALTPGDIPGAFYFTRLTTNGAGTSLGVSSGHQYFQKIEFGTRHLCGNGRKVSISFWARSSIANKRICLALQQNYGSGGSPSTAEYILGTPITLTSSWAKYTVTFTTNTLVGKTFGTNNDDYLVVDFFLMWGTTFGNAQVSAGVTAETYVGSGDIDIAQVQCNAGDAYLSFQPKSYSDELKDCQRYCFVPDTSDGNVRIGTGGAISTTIGRATINLPVKMRRLPTLTATAGQFVYELAGATSPAGSSIVIGGTQNSMLSPSIDLTTSGLTAGQAGALRSAGNNLLVLDAEI